MTETGPTQNAEPHPQESRQRGVSQDRVGPCRPHGPSPRTSESMFPGLQGLSLPRLETAGWAVDWEGGVRTDTPSTRS